MKGTLLTYAIFASAENPDVIIACFGLVGIVIRRGFFDRPLRFENTVTHLHKLSLLFAAQRIGIVLEPLDAFRRNLRYGALNIGE